MQVKNSTFYFNYNICLKNTMKIFDHKKWGSLIYKQRRDFLILVLIGTGALALSGFNIPETSKKTHPNIVLILADDFGWGDARCYNPEAGFQTPNIDRIAHEGIRFTNAYTPHSVCTPTRYTLLTGRYAWRTWMREGVLSDYSRSLIPPTRLTLASMLKKHGYATGVFGKWHLGLDWQPVEGDPGDWQWGTQRGGGAVPTSFRVDHSKPLIASPNDIGFDHSFISPANNPNPPIFVRNYYVDGIPERDPDGTMRDPRARRDKVDDIYVAESVDFLEKHLAKKDGNPFFIYLPLNAIHLATLVPERFKGKSGVDDAGDKCLWVDESVGKVLEVLDKYDLSGNSLVIFTSDNGPLAPRVQTKQHQPAGPYRGYKTDAWDGGYRIPFIARWPGSIPAGSTSDQLFSLTDVFATIAALVGHELPQWAGEDSFNQLPSLLGKSPPYPVRQSIVLQSYTGILSIRTNRWKLILDTKGSGGHVYRTPGYQPRIQGPPWEIMHSATGQLYDMVNDPYETRDLYDSNLAGVIELKRMLEKLIRDERSRP
jgi:arylsulfatase A